MQKIAEVQKHFNGFLESWFKQRSKETELSPRLTESIHYSLFSGGKRFRPLLCYAMAEQLGLSFDKVDAFAAAVECVHTYSLIHDDLPCMDDDDERRGLPTNHKKYNEAVALLAGDALLTEAFLILAQNYGEKTGELSSLLSKASGWSGMIMGQALDLGEGKTISDANDLRILHQLKTGRLIALCLQGVGVIANSTPEVSLKFFEIGDQMGLAFQVKDDIMDMDNNEDRSFIRLLGKSGTETYLKELTDKITKGLQNLSASEGFLAELVRYNLERQE